MNANIDFINDINERYSSLEFELEKKLKTIEAAEAKFEEEKVSDGNSEMNSKDDNPLNILEAKKRNKKFLEDLEEAKARLRSRVVYSPLEDILKKAKDNYFAALGASSARKKKYGPIFV